MQDVVMWIVVAVVVLGGLATLVDRYAQGGARLVAAAASEDHRRCAYCGKRLKHKSWASQKRMQVCKWCGREQPEPGWSLTHRMEGGQLVPRGSEPPPAAGPTRAQTPVGELGQQIAQLKSLRDEGALTEAEFRTATDRLLHGHGQASATDELGGPPEHRASSNVQDDDATPGAGVDPPRGSAAGRKLLILAALVLVAVVGATMFFNYLNAQPTGPVPSVVGDLLPEARATLERLGYEVEIVDEGFFGVVVESAWAVCEQSPEAGSEDGDLVTLYVDRPGDCPSP